MKHKKLHPIVLLLGSCAIVLGSLFLFAFRDMTGKPYPEIAAYIQAHPYKYVRYTVTIDGGERPMKVRNTNTVLTLTALGQTDSLIAQAEYLQHLTEITFAPELTPAPKDIVAVRQAFPNTFVGFAQTEFSGLTYPQNTEHLDLSQLKPEQISEAVYLLQALENLQSITLSNGDAISSLTIPEAATLQKARPDVQFQYTTQLFGQTISTDMETVEYFRVPIGDDGLDSFRQLMPMMHELTYMKLDTCDISNEAMAQFREEFADQCKVVWRVFFGQNNALTDTYKIWATWNIDTKEVDDLKYCNEVKYLDLGHNSFRNLDFMQNMTDLEMAIVAIGNLEDISGIVNCTKLEFLEIFSNRSLTDEDMQHLSSLTNMKYLNISNTILMRDLSFTDNMPKLRKLWCTISRVPWAETQRVKELHPDCEFVFLSDGDPTDYGWRYTRESGYREMTPEYALVRARFGYSNWDFSRDEKGYLREEITYESLGLTPT